MIYEVDKQGIGRMQFLSEAESSSAGKRTAQISFFPVMQ